MSSIFISHSSQDAAFAAEVAEWLKTHRHTSIFLDFDPERGIVAGENWERALYRKLRACRTVIALCTDNYLSSRWCFAELALARMEGKRVIAITAAPFNDSNGALSLVADTQVIDFRANRSDGFKRLARGLAADDIFGAPGDWSPNRPPYLGLSAFQEEHAAVFFGREDETRTCLELLARGAPSLVVILGASGSGKSSLARAGVIPRLRRHPETWIVIDPFRPSTAPFLELATSLEHTAQETAPDVRNSEAWRPAVERIRCAGDEPQYRADRAAEDVTELIRALRHAAPKDREARAVLVIDQFDELLQQPDSAGQANRFVAMLRDIVDRPKSPISVLATLRSDFFAAFQTSPALRGVDFDELSLGPMSRDGLRRVIEEPARLGATELEVGLADRLLDDTETADALPLLSFALRKLWMDAHERGRLTVDDYERFGGIEGALKGEADAILRSAESEGRAGALRRAFLRMARVTEDGAYARRPARWDGEELRTVSDIIERFIERRLLVSRTEGDTRVVEVAHEALFRSWGALRRWLEDERAALLLEAQIRRDTAAWSENRQRSDALWRGGRLQQAAELSRAGRLGEEEDQFVRTGVRRERGRRTIFVGGAAVLAAVLTGAALFSLNMARNATAAARMATANRLVTESSNYLGNQHALALLLSVEALELAKTPETVGGLFEALDVEPYLTGIRELSIAESGGIEPQDYCREFDLTSGFEREDQELFEAVQGRSALWDSRRWVGCRGASDDGETYMIAACRQRPLGGGAPGCANVDAYYFSREYWNARPATPPIRACDNLRATTTPEGWGQLGLNGSYDEAARTVSVTGEGVELAFPSRTVETLSSHGLLVDGVALSPDRRLAATSFVFARHMSQMVTVLWDTEARQTVGTVFRYPGGWYQGDEYRYSDSSGYEAPGIVFSDDRTLVFCGEQNPAVINLDVDAWRERACSLAGRELTEAEWGEFLGSQFKFAPACRAGP